jgi:hypothetical protein
VKGLQHDADAAAPGAGERVLAHAVEIGARDVDRAAGRLLHAGQHRHQRGFAEPDGPEQSHGLARRDAKSTPRRMSTRAALRPSDRVTLRASMT